MSLIATCLEIQEKPLEYLTAVIEWRHKINKVNATEWFPHNYKKQLAEVQKEFAQIEGALLYRVCRRRSKSLENQEETSPDCPTEDTNSLFHLKDQAKSTKAQTVH